MQSLSFLPRWPFVICVTIIIVINFDLHLFLTRKQGSESGKASCILFFFYKSRLKLIEIMIF